MAKKTAIEGNIVTFGIKPTYPATGFGYVKSKNAFANNFQGPYQIESFIEKPNSELAEKFYQDEKYSWNSGIFMAKATIFIKELEIFAPEIILHCRNSLRKKINDLDFERLDKNSFQKCPNISIDKAIMEKTSKGVVFPLKVDWSDIGLSLIHI